MKRTFIAVGLALALGMSVGNPAEAKTPPEVLEPYKAYRAALKAKDNDEAAIYAYEAWQAAEDAMGDTKTTGDLASNFAELRPQYINDKRAWKKIMSAHKRAIDLSVLYEENPTGVEIDRRTKYLAWLIPNVSSKRSEARSPKYSQKRLGERIVELNLQGSTFDAESQGFKAQAKMMSKRWKESEAAAKRSIELFDTRTDGVFSVYEYAVPIYLARAQAEQDRPIDAALTYQALMDKLEVRGGHDNVISSGAYGEWIRLRDIVSEMESDDPRAQEVVSYTVPIGRAKELSPLIRQPPMFPPSFLRNSHSGFVRVKFNVDINGHVIDPIILSSTNKSLHKATLKSLEGWRYTPNLPEARSRDVETMIRFDLLNSRGKRLSYGEEKGRI